MPERVPLNLKAPAKPTSRKALRARKQESLALLADLRRQDVPSSVRTTSSPSPWPRRLHIAVPDTDDWTAFCADLLEAGQVQWWLQGDREARYNKNDPSVPQFETWAAFRKALLQIGNRYWETTGTPTRKVGRPDVLNRCWRALWKELKAAQAAGRLTYREKDIVPLMKGHPITQDEVQGMIRTGAHDSSPGAHNLSDKVCQKYGRLLYLAFAPPPKGTPSDHAFMKKYLIPYFKKNNL